MYKYIIFYLLNTLSMEGTYIHFNKPFPYSLVTTYIDFKIINIDLLNKKCQFYSHEGDFIGKINITSAAPGKIICSHEINKTSLLIRKNANMRIGLKR